jgi:hypothetical protein
MSSRPRRYQRRLARPRLRVEQLEDRRLLSAGAAAAVTSPGAAGATPAQAQQRLQTVLNSTPLDPTHVQVAAAVIAEVPVLGRSAPPPGSPQPTPDTAQVVVFQASDPSGTAATGVVIVRQPGGPPAAPGALPAGQGQGSAGGTTGSAGGATPTGLGSLEAGLSAALDLPTTTPPAAGAPDSSPGPVLTAVQTTSRGGLMRPSRAWSAPPSRSSCPAANTPPATPRLLAPSASPSSWVPPPPPARPTAGRARPGPTCTRPWTSTARRPCRRHCSAS